MTSLRQQLTNLAQELSAETERRQQFVVKNRQETQRMCERFQREREQVGQQIRRQAQKVSRDLDANRQAIRRTVARTLSVLKSRRMRWSSEQRMQRNRLVADIRRGVAKSLQQHRANLISNGRQRAISSAQSMARLRSRVAKVRSDSVRLTSTTASDLLAGRRALAAMRSHRQAASRETAKRLP